MGHVDTRGMWTHTHVDTRDVTPLALGQDTPWGMWTHGHVDTRASLLRGPTVSSLSYRGAGSLGATGGGMFLELGHPGGGLLIHYSHKKCVSFITVLIFKLWAEWAEWALGRKK